MKALYYYYPLHLDSPFASWYESGQIKFQAIEKKGVPEAAGEFLHNGTSRTWHENGQLMLEVIYKKGVPISEKWWDEDGKPSSH